jgi:opacity protein-like surface antigen
MRKKQKFLVGLASLTLLDIAVAAAAEPAPVASYDWSGFYVGGHAGFRWADANFSGPGYSFDTGGGVVTFPARNESYPSNGGIFGVQAGYNVMLTPMILVGLEGDWTWGSSNQSITTAFSGIDSFGDGFTFSRTSEIKLTWQATVRARAGLVNGPWLFYGTIGPAFAHVNWSENSQLVGNFFGTFNSSWNTSITLTGWAVGGGVEYMYTSNWIARLEYLHENFGSNAVPYGFGPQTGNLDLRDVNKVRVAISYKFGR